MRNKFTYGDLKQELDQLTPEQLTQEVLWGGEGTAGRIGSVWILEEDHANPSGDGIEPLSGYPEEEQAEIRAEETIFPAGMVVLMESEEDDDDK